MKTNVSPLLVKHIATLANIPVSATEENSFAEAFTQTLEVIDELRELDVSEVPPTHHVTELTNGWREDEVESFFSQQDALANASRTHQGYFVVPRVLEEK